MKRELSMALMCAAAFGLIACLSSEPVAPADGLEPISVAVVQSRTVTNGVPMSAVDVNGGLGSVTIRVTTPALCAILVSAAANAILVSAAANQVGGEVNVVSIVGSDPRANCTPIPTTAVVDYVGTVRDLPAGTYRVKVFESIAERDPRFIGSKVVKVTGGEN